MRERQGADPVIVSKLAAAGQYACTCMTSRDPAVKRLSPKLVRSVSRDVALSENTLAFGRADEPTPQLQRFCVGDIIDDVVTQETLAFEDANQIQFQVNCNVDEVRADPEQLYRVLQNLVRNARQAFVPSGGRRITAI